MYEEHILLFLPIHRRSERRYESDHKKYHDTARDISPMDLRGDLRGTLPVFLSDVKVRHNKMVGLVES
jgi:hypothetical protein